MRLTYPYQTERLGAVRIFGLQHVFELESGMIDGSDDSALSWGTTVCHVPGPALQAVQRKMAIVVPCMNEKLRLFEGVLSGIPHDCLLIFVSNSDREPVDRFAMERDSIERFCRFNQRPGVVVHQRDSGVAAALVAGGMPELVDAAGTIHPGKGEAMILGMALARVAGKEYVGFVDADNYVPGSVAEYINAFAADFHLAQTPYSMVRVNWKSKPKVIDGALHFSRFGRVSETTDRFLNLFLSHLTGFGTEAIRTGNAGEHAMSMALGVELHLATGFAVEPWELVEVFERFGGCTPRPGSIEAGVMQAGLEVFQVETLNPHFHEDKGDSHVQEMRQVALAGIHNAGGCPPRLSSEIERELRRDGVEDLDVALAPIKTYPPLAVLDWGRFAIALSERSNNIAQFSNPNLFAGV